MITFPVTIQLPLQAIADAVGPEVMRAVEAARREKEAGRKTRPVLETLLQAVGNLSGALTRYENSVGSRDEPRAFNALIAASKGVRTAQRNYHHPL
ncbi:MAG: hypothetical protein ACOH2J_18255 [Allorhizobium sp.]